MTDLEKWKASYVAAFVAEAMARGYWATEDDARVWAEETVTDAAVACFPDTPAREVAIEDARICYRESLNG